MKPREDTIMDAVTDEPEGAVGEREGPAPRDGALIQLAERLAERAWRLGLGRPRNGDTRDDG